jgi:N-formylglutamate amidohydrolase
MERITNLYGPYHAALEGLIARSQQLFDLSILIDLHSMPSSSTDVAGCDIVLGDRFGSSAAGWIVDELHSSLRAAGLSVRYNKPYAGGYITERYGRPVQNRHAVQVEFNRALYMDERSISRLPTAGAVSNILVKAIGAIAELALALNLGRPAAE